MPWDVEYTPAFGRWWRSLEKPMQEAIAHDVEVLGLLGPGLGRPTVDTVVGSRFSNRKELRTRHKVSQVHVFFAFGPRRCAILLIGGDKSGDRRFDERMIPIADRIYGQHLASLST